MALSVPLSRFTPRVGGGLKSTQIMNLSKLSHDELLTRCSWCHGRMREDEECFGAGARVRPEAKVLLAGQDGKMLPLRLTSGRDIIVVVPGADSAAHADGYDVYFQTCSEACCRELTVALRAELTGRN